MPSDLSLIKRKVAEQLEEIRKELSFLVTFDANQRSSVTRVGNTLEPFLKRTYTLSKSRLPEVDAQNFEDFRKEFELWHELESTAEILRSLTAAVEDTRLQAGSNAMLRAFAIYNDVKMNAGQFPELAVILRELDEYLPPKNQKRNS